jgi:hypothetical protein
LISTAQCFPRQFPIRNHWFLTVVNNLIPDIFSYTVDRLVAKGKCSLAALPF